MSLSQRDTDLIFRKREITGRNALTPPKQNMRLPGETENDAEHKDTRATNSNTNENRNVARLVIEESTGLLRTGNTDNQAEPEFPHGV